MQYLQQEIPNTARYMYAGYAVIFSVMLVYVASLIIRFSNLKRDLDTLSDLEKK